MEKEIFGLYEFKGQKVLFTPSHAHHLKEPVPQGLYQYEIRHSDEGFEPCVLAKHIIVNHYGTIFSSAPIDLGTEGYIDFAEDIDFVDLNEDMTFDEYFKMMENELKEQDMTMKMTM